MNEDNKAPNIFAGIGRGGVNADRDKGVQPMPAREMANIIVLIVVAIVALRLLMRNRNVTRLVAVVLAGLFLWGAIHAIGFVRLTLKLWGAR